MKTVIYIRSISDDVPEYMVSNDTFDSVERIQRMLWRYAYSKDYQSQMLYMKNGELNGIISCIFITDMPFEYLQNESRTHKVTVKSAWKDNIRYTSFVKVSVIPYDANIKVNRDDFKVTKLSGYGTYGYSATVIRHQPSVKIDCKLGTFWPFKKKDKDDLIKVLSMLMSNKSKQLEDRRYVLDPYFMIKDSNVEITDEQNVMSVLDGNLDLLYKGCVKNGFE